MAAIPRPQEVVEITTPMPGVSLCGGTGLFTRRFSSIKKRYYESEYTKYVLAGLPLPYMPYLHQMWDDHYVNGSTPSGAYASIHWCFGGMSADLVPWTDLEKAASIDFYKRLTDQDSFNLAVSLAEMKETVGMIAHSATRLGLAYRYLRRGKVGAAFTALNISSRKKLSANDVKLAGLPRRKGGWTANYHRKHLEHMVPKNQRKLRDFAANTWMEIQYGWTPTLLDVYGAAKFAADYFNNRSFDLELHGQAKVDFSGPGRVGSPSNVTGSCHTQAVVRYQARLAVIDPNLRLAASLGLTNPALVIWEKIPFSFVVDWFYNCSAQLEALTVMQGYSVRESMKTRYSLQTYEGSSNRSDYPCSMQGTTLLVERTLGGIPSVTMPSFNLSGVLGIPKALTSLSLLRQLTK